MINYCTMIHETVIRDVLDMLDDLKNADIVDAINNRKQNKSFRSIASATQNLTLVFPCIVSRGMSIETSSMYSKAIERKAVSMLQMLFSALSITNAEDGISYLKNFHTNLKLDGSMSIDKFMNMMDNLVLEGAVKVENEELYKMYLIDRANLSNYLPSSIQESHSLSDYTIYKPPYSLEESYVLNEKKDDFGLYDDEIDYLDSIIDTEDSNKKKKKETVKEFYNPLNIVGMKRVTSHGIPYDDIKYSRDPQYSLMIDKLDRQAMFTMKKQAVKEEYTNLNGTGNTRYTLHGIPYDDRRYGKDPIYSIDIDRKDRDAMFAMKKQAVKEGTTANGIYFDEDEYMENPTYALNVDKADLQARQNGINNNMSASKDLYQRGLNAADNTYKSHQDYIKNSQSDRSYNQTVKQNDTTNQHNADNLTFQKSKANNDLEFKNKDYTHREKRDKIDDDRYDANQEYREKRDEREDDKFTDKMTLDRDRFNSDKVRNNIDYLKNQLLDNDVKKPNELVPTTMIVNYVSKGENGGRPIQAQSVIGVKAKLYPVNSDDIMKRIAIKHIDKNWLIGLIKASTREISFFRDFLFAVDQAKLDALSQSRKGSSSKLWKVLIRRGIKSRIKRTIGSINDASAITSLAITQEEVEYLKKSQDIDVEDPKVIRPIMEAYNLMCFSIFDEINEVGKFIFDTGDDLYEELSFRSLEREDKGNDYRKIVNLMSKMR